MMRVGRLRMGVVAAIVLLLILACAEKKPPSREHIPLLRQTLQKLGETVVSQNRAAIDSVLSVQILDNDQSSDSLLRFVYGPGRDYEFIGFTLGEITYRNNVARIDCFVADSSRGHERPAVLTLVWEHERWLLKHFEVGKGEASMDSTTE